LSVSPALTLAPPGTATPPPVPALAPQANPATDTPAAAGPSSAPAKSSDKPLEALRDQYHSQAEADLLAREKAIAAAALEPPELRARLATDASAAPAVIGPVSTLQLPRPDAAPAGPAPAAGGPLPGLRVPTPELAAAFLASNPTPAAARESAPGSGPEAPNDARPKPPVPPRKKTANPEQILIVVGSILAVVIGCGLMGVYLYLRAPAKAPPPAGTTEETPPEPPPAATPTPATPAPDSAETAPAATTSTVPAATPTDTPPGPPPASPATDQPPATGEATPPAPPPPRVNRPDPTILAWVQKIELTGIRGGSVPKAFMNGRLYEVGEVVNFQLGLKLTAIKGKVLHFEDAEGNTYEYRF
jgi:hypothetical protein